MCRAGEFEEVKEGEDSRVGCADNCDGLRLIPRKLGYEVAGFEDGVEV